MGAPWYRPNKPPNIRVNRIALWAVTAFRNLMYMQYYLFWLHLGHQRPLIIFGNEGCLQPELYLLTEGICGAFLEQMSHKIGSQEKIMIKATRG